MLTINNISKMYSGNIGLKKFNLECKNGDIVSLIGPNGSGKSTAIKMIVGIMKPDEGNVFLNDQDTLKNSSKIKIGYMPDRLHLYGGLSVYETMKLISDYKFQGKYADEIQRILVDFDIWKRKNDKVENLSMGLKKKLLISMAFLGESQLIVLDEPTNGLDTLGIIKLKDYIIEAKKRGGIVVISSHVLDFVGSICDKNVFLKEGEKLIVENNYKDLEGIYRRLYIENSQVD